MEMRPCVLHDHVYLELEIEGREHVPRLFSVSRLNISTRVAINAVAKTFSVTESVKHGIAAFLASWE